MRTILLTAVAALALVAASAQASPGDSDPFPFRAPSVTVQSPQPYADTGSHAYPDLAGRPSQVVTAGGFGVVPITGSQAGVNTANSLPRGFQDGTVAYAQQQSVLRYLAAQQAAQATRLARTTPAAHQPPRG